MDGLSAKGEPESKLPLSTRSTHEDDHLNQLDRLQEHCALLDEKIEFLSLKIQSLEAELLAERNTREDTPSTKPTSLISPDLEATPRDQRLQLLNNISHELRTPLNGILGMAQLMLDAPLSAELRDHTTSILEAGKHLESLVGDLLDYTRLQHDDVTAQFESFNLLNILEDLTHSYAGSASLKGLTLHLIVDQSIRSTVVSAPHRLKQVVALLLDNAVKFTHQGTIELQANVVEKADKPWLQINVKDTGVGIEAESLPLIYHPFWQADTSNTRKHGGLGIGLSLSRALISLLGGTLQHHSQIGEGTTSVLALPLEAWDLLPLSQATEELSTLTIGTYQLDVPHQKMVTEYLSWWDMSALPIHNLKDVQKASPAFDVIMVQHHPKHVEQLRELSNHIENRSMPLFLGIVSPSDQLHTLDKRHYDIRLDTPIFEATLLDSLTFAARTLRHRQPVAMHARPEQVHPTTQKVILIETNRINLKIMGQMLHALGIQVDILDSTEQNAITDLQGPYLAIMINTSLNLAALPHVLSKLEERISLTGKHRYIGLHGKNTSREPDHFQLEFDAFLTIPSRIDDLKALLIDQSQLE